MGIWKKPGAAKEWPKKNESPRDLFTLEVEAILSEMPEVTSFKRRSDEFVLDVTSNGIEHAVFLENTFHETREMSPEARAERIRRVVSTIGSDSSALDWEEVRERIVPLVRASTIFLAMIEDGAKMPLSRP